MRQIGTFIAVLIAGASMEALVANALHAQQKPRAFFVADVSDVSNSAAFGEAIRKTTPIIVASGGKYLARTQTIVPIAGSPPKRFVIVAFENMDIAKAWANKPELKALYPEIDENSKQRRFLVEGM